MTVRRIAHDEHTVVCIWARTCCDVHVLAQSNSISSAGSRQAGRRDLCCQAHPPRSGSFGVISPEISHSVPPGAPPAPAHADPAHIAPAAVHPSTAPTWPVAEHISTNSCADRDVHGPQHPSAPRNGRPRFRPLLGIAGIPARTR